MSECKCMTPRPTNVHRNRIKELEAENKALREAAQAVVDGQEEYNNAGNKAMILHLLWKDIGSLKALLEKSG